MHLFLTFISVGCTFFFWEPGFLLLPCVFEGVIVQWLCRPILFPSSADALVSFLLSLFSGMIYWGQQAYKNLDALMAEMKDPAVVDAMFAKFDSNQNGCEILNYIYCGTTTVVLRTLVTRLRCGWEVGVYFGGDRPTEHCLVVA